MAKKGKSRKGPIPVPDIDLTIVPGIPRVVPEPLDDERPSWSFAAASRGIYALPFDCGEEMSCIISFLRDVECRTIRALKNEKCSKNSYRLASYNIEECRANMKQTALDYLEKHHLGTDEVYRFRLDGDKRLYAIRHGSVFGILWWDPNHEIYRTE